MSEENRDDLYINDQGSIDEFEWEKTEIWEEDREHKGFTLSNLTKNPKGDKDED